MNVITHALLPALLAVPVLPRDSRKEFFRAAGLVAIAGALPDLIYPHLSLHARFASWSHSVFALAAFGLLLAGISLLGPQQLPWKLAALAWLAFGLHLFSDAVSGGIAWLQPLSPEVLRTRPRWVPHRWWLWLDLGCIAAALAVVMVMGRRFDRQNSPALNRESLKS